MPVFAYPIFKVSIFIGIIIMICFGVCGFVKQKRNKKINSTLIIISLFLVYSVFFSCFILRPAMFKEESLNLIASAIKDAEKKNGSEYFYNTVFYNNCNIASVGESCSVYLLTECNSEDYIEDTAFGSPFSRVLSKEYTTDYGSFWCSAVHSDGTFTEYHTGYDGLIVYKDLAGKEYCIEYSVSRVIDILIGPLYAFPYYGECNVAELVQTTQGESSMEAFL